MPLPVLWGNQRIKEMMIYEDSSPPKRHRTAAVVLLAVVLFQLYGTLNFLSTIPASQERIIQSKTSELEMKAVASSMLESAVSTGAPVSSEIERDDPGPTTEQIAPSPIDQDDKRKYSIDVLDEKTAATRTPSAQSVEVNTSLPLCKRRQVIEGQWSPTDLQRPPYVSYTKHLRCHPIEYFKQIPFKTWEWLPTDQTCDFTSWNEQDFCSLLPFATISIIGDSLSWEMFSSLLQLLGTRVYQKSQHESKSKNKNHILRACEGKTKFVFRNDARLRNVQDSLEKDFPTVLILNRGPHYENDTSLMSDLQQTFQEVEDWLQVCESRDMKCHFFWRTSVPGHPGCGNFTEPVNDIEEMEALISNLDLYNNRSINYHWYDYQHQNELVLAALEKSGIPYEVIDGYYLNVRRPDGHRSHQDDCLHNCYPGKMDVFNQLLLHYLKIQRSSEDVDRLVKQFQKLATSQANESAFSNS